MSENFKERLVNSRLPVIMFALAVIVSDISPRVSSEKRPARQAPTPTPIPAGAPNAGWTPVIQEFDGVEMVQVPAGCFTMGSTDAQASAAFQACEAVWGTGKCRQDWFDREKPAHPVCLTQPFWIDRIEVFNAQFAAFNGQAASESVTPDANQPRDQIAWDEAQAFCASRGARLPTEAEWEYAARGPEGLIFPWGNVFDSSNVPWQGHQTTYAPVGSFPAGASWVGALDLSGNVFEWVADWYGPYTSAAQTDPAGPESGTTRVIRGGAFDIPGSYDLRGAYRSQLDPAYGNGDVGFRCARSATPPQTSVCPGTLPPRLAVGGQGRLVPNTDPNNVRAQPVKSAAKVGQIGPGDVFTVRAGPQCGDGLNWWQVTVGSMTGWTAEGDAQGYWIEPVGK